MYNNTDFPDMNNQKFSYNYSISQTTYGPVKYFKSYLLEYLDLAYEVSKKILKEYGILLHISTYGEHNGVYNPDYFSVWIPIDEEKSEEENMKNFKRIAFIWNYKFKMIGRDFDYSSRKRGYTNYSYKNYFKTTRRKNKFKKIGRKNHEIRTKSSL